MTNTRTALVTGANQGLGRELVAELSRRFDPGDRILLTGRDRGRVERAAQELAVGARAQIEPHVLDVRDSAAITALAEALGTVDLVISNAGARMTPGVANAEQIDDLVATNDLATIRILRAFGPRLVPGGALLVVASGLGTLAHLPAPIRARYDEAPSLGALEAVIEDWRAAVRDGRDGAEGWPEWINLPSKAAQVAAVRIFARDRRAGDLGRGTLIASVCPGLIDTDASRPWFDDMSEAWTPAQGAQPIVDLALGDRAPGAYGELVQRGTILPWHPDRDEARPLAATIA
ncbi:MAG: SDR family NAD(P)-dependent oxidoreductase [Solirubrobacteraceae bacterium]|nr:SDR family NAD(P)-dependent oxidoreductase [Solirubrobacteraceae bacterium]